MLPCGGLLTIEVCDLRQRLLEGLHFDGIGRVARIRELLQRPFLGVFRGEVFKCCTVRFPIYNRAGLRLPTPTSTTESFG